MRRRVSQVIIIVEIDAQGIKGGAHPVYKRVGSQNYSFFPKWQVRPLLFTLTRSWDNENFKRGPRKKFGNIPCGGWKMLPTHSDPNLFQTSFLIDWDRKLRYLNKDPVDTGKLILVFYG